jgi:hypothetical protein
MQREVTLHLARQDPQLVWRLTSELLRHTASGPARDEVARCCVVINTSLQRCSVRGLASIHMHGRLFGEGSLRSQAAAQAAMALTPQQRTRIVELRRDMFQRMRLLVEERRRILAQLQVGKQEARSMPACIAYF